MKAVSERGGALLLVMIVLVILFGMAGAYLGLVSHDYAATLKARDGEVAFSIAESGIDAALNELNAQVDYDGDGLGTVKGTLGGGDYKVSLKPGYWGPARYVLRSEGRSASSRRGIVAVVDASAPSADRFASAVFGDFSVEIGNNASVDSYDSSVADYASSVGRRLRNQSYANTRGNVRSNGGVRVGPNAKVFGDVTAGASSETSLVANAYVDGASTRAVAPEALPPIEVPSLPDEGELSVKSRLGSVLDPGKRHLTSLVVEKGSTLTVRGPATLVLDRFVMDSQATIILDGTGGPITIYVTQEFGVNPSARWVSTTRNPSELALRIAINNVMDPTKRVELSGVGPFFGTVYAPDAALTLDGRMEVFGAVAARTVSLGIGAKVHYDEAIAPSASAPEFRLISIEEIALAPTGSSKERDEDKERGGRHDD